MRWDEFRGMVLTGLFAIILVVVLSIIVQQISVEIFGLKISYILASCAGVAFSILSWYWTTANKKLDSKLDKKEFEDYICSEKTYKEETKLHEKESKEELMTFLESIDKKQNLILEIVMKAKSGLLS